MYADLRHLWALDQLNLAQGAGAAIGLAFEEDESEARRVVDDLIRDALPEG